MKKIKNHLKLATIAFLALLCFYPSHAQKHGQDHQCITSTSDNNTVGYFSGNKNHLDEQTITTKEIASTKIGINTVPQADSIKFDFETLKKNLDVFQQNKRTSIFLMLGGAAVTGIGVAAYQSQVTKFDGNTSIGSALMGIGGAVQLTGSIMFIDSFRWITTKERRKRSLNLR